ncbi:MAG TPA: NAD-dependent epimerase/dehydratase family protein [Arenimonas sp.]|uniref:SDR family oxidoreductase n=1 Tax=Arenimonas sp. TaxID=1872635 RepID=UPI002B933096|nr:NAD-dependent epimerase/dehydratase family protein [Arenimonas sp.]HMB57563.1 NAD-dependent epimerase/dehydratase family protein [Arenimonas sp.]
MSRVLVLGLSGQVGQALKPRLLARGVRLLAVTRQARPAEAGIEWLHAALPVLPALPADIDTILSLGPLDAFADWFGKIAPAGVRVIALGSTSRQFKHDSPDPDEQVIAARLIAAEQALFAHPEAAVTLLRPTLIYGAGRDRSLSPLIAFARRWGWLVLPRNASGLRQPVHVDDIAEAVLRCLDRPGTAGKAYDLPGSEALSFEAMVRRSLERQAPGSRIWRIPSPMFGLLLRLGQATGRLPVNARGFLARLQRDQSVDPGPIEADLDLVPRPFQP